MRDDADQALRRIARQTRVRVERDAVADGRQQLQFADLRREGGVGGAAQQPVELFDLAALPLPADPRVLAYVPLPIAMKQEEPVGVAHAELAVERFHARPRAFENRGVFRSVDRARIGKVTENREMDAGVEVSQREHLDVFEERIDARGAGQHRGNDDHGPGSVRDAAGKVETRQPFRADRVDNPILDARNREVARRQQHQQRDHEPDGRRGACVHRIGNCSGDQEDGHERDGAKVER